VGFRYRLHDKKLSGKLDVVLKKYKICFYSRRLLAQTKKLPLAKYNAERQRRVLTCETKPERAERRRLEGIG
jgi:G:T-mismatch repair DNA endonuclease (very short patch repair protein)